MTIGGTTELRVNGVRLCFVQKTRQGRELGDVSVEELGRECDFSVEGSGSRGQRVR